MSNPPSYDQHLLDRLNALRKSSVELDPSKPQPLTPKASTSTPETDLSARLKSLRNGTPSSTPSPSKPSPSPGSTSQPSASSSAEPSFSSFPPLPSENEDPLRRKDFGFLDGDDRTLDELLADLGPDDQWTLNPDDPKDIKRLMDEARGALPRDSESKSQSQDSDQENEGGSGGKNRQANSQYLSRDLDMSVFALDDGDHEGEDGEESGKEKGKKKAVDLDREAREAQDIVRRMMDEVNLERSESNPDKDEGENENDEDASSSHNPKGQAEDEEDDNSSFSLPSAPSSLPEITKKKSQDFESDISARMAALSAPTHIQNSLGLPSAPTFAPIDKPVKGVMKKTFTDEEVDSWCIICQDDATVKCVGCEGDLYCAGCWKEGHMGPDVGFEEKGHKWVKWRKPN